MSNYRRPIEVDSVTHEGLFNMSTSVRLIAYVLLMFLIPLLPILALLIVADLALLVLNAVTNRIHEKGQKP